MTISLASAVASAMADQITAKVDAGTGAGTLKIYTGAKPSTPETAATGTLLATFTLADPVAAASAAGVATWNSAAITATVAASGTAGWFRVADSAGNAVFDGAVGTSGADLNFSTVVWTAGGSVTLNGSGTVTQPTS